MKRSVSWVLLTVALAFIAGAAVMQDAHSRAQLSFYSTYDTGPNGYRAIYETLASAHVPVRRFEREIGLLDGDVGTFVVSSIRPELDSGATVNPIDASDAKRLARFVARGGRLVVLNDRDTSALGPFGLTGRREARSANAFAVVTRIPLLTGVERIVAPASYAYSYAALREAVPLFGTRDGAVAAIRPYGKGFVVSVLTPDVFSNRFIERGDNARFAFALLDDGRPVVFDERVHGYAVDKSFWAALPVTVHIAVWVLLAIGVLLLIDANLRFAPAVDAEPPDERDSSAFIASMAALLRRSRAGRALIARFADDAAQRLRSRVSASDRSRSIGRELERLSYGNARVRDDAVVRAARLHAQLRKDLA